MRTRFWVAVIVGTAIVGFVPGGSYLALLAALVLPGWAWVHYFDSSISRPVTDRALLILTLSFVTLVLTACCLGAVGVPLNGMTVVISTAVAELAIVGAGAVTQGRRSRSVHTPERGIAPRHDS